MKRIISAFLTIALIFCMIPVGVNADEIQLVTITIIHKDSTTDGVHKNLSVIEAGEDLLFSGEDLAMLGGFEYRIEEGSAYFSRGIKTLRVDLSASRLYPFEDITLVGKIDFAEKIQEIDGVYYFPASEMLPWLNVTCLMLDGVLNIQTDDVSIWEIIPQFTPDEFAFDFTACCKELGVNGKYLKARAYLQDEGISGMFFDLIPVVGDYLDYYDLFEDALQDQSAAAEEMESLLDNAEDADYWMGIADDVDVIEDLPDEIRVFGEAAKILANNAVSFAFELGIYVKHFYLHDENILTALFSMELNSNLYGLPDSATTALVEIRENYSDYYAGIENKMMLAIGETALDGLTDSAEGLYKAAVTLLGFAEATSPDWAEGINRISSYDVIAEYCVSGYNEMTNQTWRSSVRDLRSLAYMYLYACEQNWMAMADYAAKEGKLDLKAKYEANADAAEDWQRIFMRATTSEQNDSHEYGEATGGMKQEYTDMLKAVFSNIPRSAIVEPIIIKLTWDGRYDDGELMQLYPNLSGTFDDGKTLNLYADCTILGTPDGNSYRFDLDEPIYYDNSLVASVKHDNSETGEITVYLYRYDGVFNFMVEDAGYGEHILDSHIQASGVKAVVKTPSYTDGVMYDLTSGVYRSYTGYWFWGPFALDHGNLSEYDASWINDTSESNEVQSAQSVNERVNEIKELYYEIQAQLSEYKKEDGGSGTTRYLDNSGNIKKITAAKSSYSDLGLDSNYAAEYYYDNNTVFFVFLYNKTEEHRIYLDKNDYLKCVRYIDADGAIHDYPDGKDINDLSDIGQYCVLAMQELHWAGLI